MATKPEEVLGPRAVLHTANGDVLVRRPVTVTEDFYTFPEWIFGDNPTPVNRYDTWAVLRTDVISIEFDSDVVLQGEEWRHE